jgi:uncharacterized protein (UPF0548 family)
MWFLRRPSTQHLEQIRSRYEALLLTYPEVGCTRGQAPPGYVVDDYRVRLGQGAAVFERAKQALRTWAMLRLAWLEPCWPDAQVQEGVLIGTLTRMLGVWLVNVCRIVYVINEQGPVSRYGFAYGTLPGHVECAEEQFLVAWDPANDSVWYAIRAISRPGGWLSRLAYPLARRLQRRFGRDSPRALANEVYASE